MDAWLTKIESCSVQAESSPSPDPIPASPIPTQIPTPTPTPIIAEPSPDPIEPTATPIAESLESDLQALWTFDSGDVDESSVFDVSGNSHDLGYFGSPSTVEGIYAGAMSLNGVSDAFSVATINSDAWTGITATVWIKPAAMGDHRLICKSPSVTRADHIYSLGFWEEGNVVVRLSTDGDNGQFNEFASPAGAISQNEWQHVAFTWSAEQSEVNIYVNGALIGSFSHLGETVKDSTIATVLGNGAFVDDRFFEGLMDEAAIYSRGLSEAEIAELANKTLTGDASPAPAPEPEPTLEPVPAPAPEPIPEPEPALEPVEPIPASPSPTPIVIPTPTPTPIIAETTPVPIEPTATPIAESLESDLQALWTFDSGDVDESSVFDVSGNSHDLGYFGSPSTVEGIYAGAMSLNGVSDAFSVATINSDAWTGITATVWIKPAAMGDHRLICKSPTVTRADHIYSLGFWEEGNVVVRLSTDGDNGQFNEFASPAGAISQNEWQHVAFTWSAEQSEVNIYVNGALIDSFSHLGETVKDSTITTVLGNGAFVDDRFFEGLMDEAAIYSRGLSKAEIAELANKTLTGDAAPAPAPEPEPLEPAPAPAPEPIPEPEPVLEPEPTPEPEPVIIPEVPENTIVFDWRTPTSREDGTTLELSEIDHFEIYYTDDQTGTVHTIIVNDSTATSYVLTNLFEGGYEATIVTVDSHEQSSVSPAAIRFTVQ